MKPRIHIIESPEEMRAVEDIQQVIWGEKDVVPSHMLRTVTHNGGLLLGASIDDKLAGFAFGFLGLKHDDQGYAISNLKHCSHVVGVLPEYQNQGLGFALKRAQWQMVRRQGIELITWTYDPLLSRNAHFNIDRLGAICQTYYLNYYGEMEDKLNAGLPSDRFEVELWVNSSRVQNRMSRLPRRSLDLGHYFAAGAEIINPTRLDEVGNPIPPESPWILNSVAKNLNADLPPLPDKQPPVFLLEIPSDFQTLRNSNPALATIWRNHTRALFQDIFQRGYMVTDFVYLKDKHSRSFYVLSDGKRTLGE